LRTAVLSVSWD